MSKQHWKRAISAAILAAMIAAAVPFSVSAASTDTIDSLEQQQASLQQQQAEVSSRIASLKEDQSKQLEYKQALDEQMVSIQSEINVINEKITQLDQEILSRQADIADDEAVITETFSQLKERIRALYLAGDASDLEILLNSKSIADFADKIEVMRSITSHDSELINTLKDELNKVKDQKAVIEADRKEVSASKTELESKQSEISSLVEESNAVIASINSNVDSANSLAAQLESEFNATSDQLTVAIQEYNAAKAAEEQAAAAAAAQQAAAQQAAAQQAAAEAAAQQAAQQPAQSSDSGSSYSGGGSYSGDDSSYSDSGSTYQGDGVASGQFIWPAPGTTIITSGVGPRWGTTHNGIDISGSNCYGNPIVASDGGTVIVANKSGWGGGYGLYVMIDHGNGYVTVYGHASSVIVDVGQYVSQGQTIAYIGSTGDSTGPHLHFEIRYNGVIQDPELYV